MSILQGSIKNTDIFLQRSETSRDVDYFFPPPESLTPTFLSQGVPEKTAERLSAVYIRRANELKTRLKDIVHDTVSKLSSWGNSNSLTVLQNDLYETYRRKYLSSLAECLQEACSMASRHVTLQRPPALQYHTDDKKSKRRFKSEYLPLFEFAFSKDRFPSREDKKHLARVSGMSYRQISVWFQNRRCRSGKHSRATMLSSGKDETQELELECSPSIVERVIYYQRGFDGRDCSTIELQPSSPSIIDLTANENHYENVSYEEVLDSPSSSGDDTSSEVMNDTPRIDSCLPFPSPYVPSAPTVDPFNIQLDSSLWPRHRGIKRRRVCERNLRIDDIVSDLELMDVPSRSSLSARPTKSLPKRTQAKLLSHMSHPSPSTTCLSESSDEPPLSPTSHTSSHSTVTSPESNGICLPPPLLSDSSFEYVGNKAGDQCLLGHPMSETFHYRLESLDSQGNKNEVDAFSRYAETSTIGLNLGIWSL